MPKQKSIKFIISHAAAANKKLLSVEFYSHLEVDLDLYKTINPSFSSATWAPGDLSEISALPSLVFAQKLQENSINTIMHVCGRNFKRQEALAVMNQIRRMGIKNILALKGGKCYEDPFIRFI